MLQPFMHKAAVPALLSALLLAACGGDQGAAKKEAAGGPALETLVVAAGDADGERLFDGTIEAVQQATLVAQTAGRIVALEHDVDDQVDRGAPILRIAAIEQRARLDEAQQALVAARAMSTEAGLRYERTRKLVSEKLLSQADMDQATAQRDSAQARLAAAEAGVAAAREQLGYTEVRSPFAGVVTRRFVDVGEAVSPGQPLTAVAALGALRVIVDVPQAMADGVRQLGAARVHAGEQVIPSTGITVFPAAASGSNTVRVRVELPAGVKGLVPGMFVKAGFQTGEGAILRVPATAVMLRSEVTAVYVVDAEGRPILRQVRLGRRLAGDFEVLAGLEAGERIAADPVAATLAVEGR
jgi:RND family efflux transporter MFP subunit